MRAKKLFAGLVGTTALSGGAVALPASPAAAITEIDCLAGQALHPGGGPGYVLTAELCGAPRDDDGIAEPYSIHVGLLVLVDGQGNQTGLLFDVKLSCQTASDPVPGTWIAGDCVPA